MIGYVAEIEIYIRKYSQDSGYISDLLSKDLLYPTKVIFESYIVRSSSLYFFVSSFTHIVANIIDRTKKLKPSRQLNLPSSDVACFPSC